MTIEDAKNEISYQLIKIVLQILLQQNDISIEEYEKLIIQAKIDFDPIIGGLD